MPTHLWSFDPNIRLQHNRIEPQTHRSLVFHYLYLPTGVRDPIAPKLYRYAQTWPIHPTLYRLSVYVLYYSVVYQVTSSKCHMQLTIKPNLQSIWTGHRRWLDVEWPVESERVRLEASPCCENLIMVNYQYPVSRYIQKTPNRAALWRKERKKFASR